MNEAVSEGRVVVGVDGSPRSLTALRFAFAEAARRGCGLLVVSAFEPPELWWASYYGMPVPDSVDEVRKHVEQTTHRLVVQTLKEQLDAADAPKMEVVASAGNVVDVLLSASKDAPLLVVGNRGLGGFKRMLLGSVSLQCAQHASCPVTVVHSPAIPETAPEAHTALVPEVAGVPAAIL